MGFLGPRVYESLYGEKFPDGIQTSENLYRNGVIDGVVPPVDRLRLLVNRALCVLTDPPPAPPAATDPIPSPRDSRCSRLAVGDALAPGRSTRHPAVAPPCRN